MTYIPFSKLYFLSRYSFFQTSTQPFFQSSRDVLLTGFLLLVWGLAYLGVSPAQASNHTVRFAVIGDYGGAAIFGGTSPDENAVSVLVHGWNPDFIITTGDNNYESGAQSTINPNITQYYQDYISTNRFFPSLGNHDWGQFPGGDATAYFNYFNLSGNERYYELVRGPVHLFALDSDDNEPDGNTGTSVQATWLQGRLAASTAPWKLVFFHHPPYSSGGYTTPVMRWNFQTWGATAVLSGHEHFYERLSVGGFPYLVNGLGGYAIFPCAPPCVPDNGYTADTNSLVRYNADFGAMLVQASPTCLSFQFINRSGALIDTYTIPNLLPSVDYYVRDWTDNAASGDTGVVPSTHPYFFTTSDVWNRQSNAPGGFNANNQPQNEDPKNGSGASGDNFAFARVFRNTCGNGPANTVTAHFLYSEFGTGSNFQTAGSASGSSVNFAADTVAAASTVKTMTSGHSWHLPTTSSTHLCLAVEISTPSDPAGPTLLGHTPGPADGDPMVLNDNNKAQRNMGVYHTMMKSIGKWSFYALVHNWATYKRSMMLRSEASPDVLRSKVRLAVINPKGKTLRQEAGRPLENRDTIILDDMQPGENRWIGVTFESLDGKEGESFPVSFFEVVNNKAVNGFTIAPASAPWSIVGRDTVRFHASVFARLAALAGIAKAKEDSVEAAQLLQMEKITEQDYLKLLRKQLGSINDIIAELLKPQQSEDLFGIRNEVKILSAAVQDGALSQTVPAHSTLLHKLDAFLTMLEKSRGDAADILQNVVWQNSIYSKLPQEKALECSKRRHSRGKDEHREAGDVVVESNDFRRAYEARKIGNADYSNLISDLLPCFKETAKEFGGMVHLEEDIANMVKSLDSPVALQKTHHEYLLKLHNVVKP